MLPIPGSWRIQAAPGSPLQGLNHGKPPPWGQLPWGTQASSEASGSVVPRVGVGVVAGMGKQGGHQQHRTASVTAQRTLWPGCGRQCFPTTSLASSGLPHPGPSPGPCRNPGAAAVSLEAPQLPNSVGLVRYLKEKPQVGARACFQGGHALGVRRRPALSWNGGRPCLLPLRCPQQPAPTRWQK